MVKMPQFVYLKDIIKTKQKESYQSMEPSLEPNIKEKVMRVPMSQGKFISLRKR